MLRPENGRIPIPRSWVCWLSLATVGLALGRGPVALAQDPAATTTPSTPAPAAPTPREAALEERLRKVEEMNQKILQQFGSMAKQNAVLVKTVQDLKKQLDATRGQKADATQDREKDQAEDAPVGGDPGSGNNITPSPLTGGLPTPSSSDSKVEAARDQVLLKPFADRSYQQRYGFVLQSQNQEFEIRFNGLVQADSRIYEQRNQVPVIDDIDLPRVRMWFSGRLTKPIEYQVSFQRSTNSFDILNAYLNLHYDDRLQVRIGRFRAPYTYEWAKLSIWELPTPERSPFAINFGPNRQVGVMGWGNVLANRLEYAVGIFDGPRNSFQDFNYAKDAMAFLDFRPFFDKDSDSVLKLFSVGGSVDAGRQNNPLAPALLRGTVTASGNTLTTGSGDSIIAVPFLAFNNNVRERGDRALWELHATYFYKGLALLGAWESGHNDFATTALNSLPVNLPVSGYFVQASYLLTGETRERITLVAPLRPFDLRRGKLGPGAIELQARYSELEVGKQVFTAGLADPNLWTRRADFLDAGVNWYLNAYVKFMFDWQHAMFAEPVYFRPGPGLQKTSDLFWLRAQVYF
jgi:phosphate-selective porin OprO and OprP